MTLPTADLALETTPSRPNLIGRIKQRAESGSLSRRRVWAMLAIRSLLALAFQILFAVGFVIGGDPSPWRTAANWWLGSLALAEMVNLWLLRRCARREGIRLRDLYNPSSADRRGDLRWLGIGLLGAAPLALLPSVALASALWGDGQTSQDLIFRAVPVWAAWSMVLIFPVVHALTELPTYFGYVMPRLQVLSGKTWMPLVITASVLSAQHMFLPLLFDWRYLVWRAIMFLPLALWFGWIVKQRPTALPYLALAHGLLDLSLPLFVLQASLGG